MEYNKKTKTWNTQKNTHNETRIQKKANGHIENTIANTKKQIKQLQTKKTIKQPRINKKNIQKHT